MKKPKIFDVFLFFNELDLLELRLETLYEVVDYFVITELFETFSGQRKSSLFEKEKKRYEKYSDKIIYNFVSRDKLEDLKKDKFLDYLSDLNGIVSYQNSGKSYKYLHKTLKREVQHRDAAISGFIDIAEPNDFILLSDLDEIPNPLAIQQAILREEEEISYFKMEWYLYWMNNKISSPWFGTVLLKFKYLKNRSLNTIRYASSDEKNVPGNIIKNGGWHFSYLGGFQAIREKLNAHPYQGRRVQIAKFLDLIRFRKFEKVIEKNKDIFFLNREFEKIDIKKSFPNFLLKKEKIIEKYIYK
jgi:beta-1,4-mannosyl-glycoprotein beta-1,4-N-acetylglucosaminyltransferase